MGSLVDCPMCGDPVAEGADLGGMLQNKLRTLIN